MAIIIIGGLFLQFLFWGVLVVIWTLYQVRISSHDHKAIGEKRSEKVETERLLLDKVFSEGSSGVESDTDDETSSAELLMMSDHPPNEKDDQMIPE